MGKRTAWEEIDKKAPEVLEISDAIWSFAEMGYQENESMRLLCEMLQKEGVPGQRGPGGDCDRLFGQLRRRRAGNRPPRRVRCAFGTEPGGGAFGGKRPAGNRAVFWMSG